MPPTVLIALLATEKPYDVLLWRAREATSFVEDTWAWGDERERWFWRAVLEGLLHGPRQAAWREKAYEAWCA